MVQALLFDVFGTVVDWRSSVADELRKALTPHGISKDWSAMADAWRARYAPAMAKVIDGRRDYVVLDQLHRENLEDMLTVFGVSGLSETELSHLNQAWHRLRP